MAISAATDRIDLIAATIVEDQIVIPQACGSKSLLNGCIGEARLDRLGAPGWSRTNSLMEIIEIGSDMPMVGFNERKVRSGEEVDQIVKAAGVGINGLWRFLKLSEEQQPITCRSGTSNSRIIVPAYGIHASAPGYLKTYPGWKAHGKQ